MNYLRSLDMCVPVKYPPSSYAQAGVADILVCYRGKYIAIELKTKEHPDLDPLQEDFLEMVRDAGGKTAVCFSLDEVKAVMI